MIQEIAKQAGVKLEYRILEVMPVKMTTHLEVTIR